MGAKTYKLRGIVLKKTKLGEKDLIVSLLDEGGALVQGVAKGARKPGGSFAARLELFSTVDVMLAQGKSLDVVCEARIAESPEHLDWTLEKSSCAAPLAELLTAVSQPDLPQPRVFALSHAAFQRIGAREVPDNTALALCAASLWKVMSQIGFRPSLKACAVCGCAAKDIAEDTSGQLPLSVIDGGVVCMNCPRPADAIMVNRHVIEWCEALIAARYAEIESWNVESSLSFSLLQIARLWARVHVGRDLKSLGFLFTSGLFA